MQNGRPSKLTPEVHNIIVDAIQHGAYVETAAQLAGINKDSFYEWLKRGRKINEMLLEAHENEQPAISAHDEDCLNFSVAVNKAIAESEIRDVNVIDSAAQEGVWQAAAWKLERKHHNRWGRKVAVTDEQGGNFFAGMARAWANALESETDDQPYIEGHSRPLIGGSNGSGD